MRENNFLYKKFIEDGENLIDFLLDNSNIDNSNIDNYNIDNYNDLCKYNKKIDERKALLSFFVNLFKNDNDNIKIISNVLEKLLNNFQENINNENKKINNEEITDLIYIITTNIEIGNYIDKLKEITEYSPKKYSGITNKIIFKFMDIIDNYE